LNRLVLPRWHGLPLTRPVTASLSRMSSWLMSVSTHGPKLLNPSMTLSLA
jgi:hypothetical protein